MVNRGAFVLVASEKSFNICIVDFCIWSAPVFLSSYRTFCSKKWNRVIHHTFIENLVNGQLFTKIHFSLPCRIAFCVIRLHFGLAACIRALSPFQWYTTQPYSLPSTDRSCVLGSFCSPSFQIRNQNMYNPLLPPPHPHGRWMGILIRGGGTTIWHQCQSQSLSLILSAFSKIMWDITEIWRLFCLCKWHG